MTEQEILQREKELLERERELLNREKELFKAELELNKPDNDKVITDDTQLNNEYSHVPLDDTSIELKGDELSAEELDEIIIKSEKEYNAITSDTNNKRTLTTILLCGILILIGLTVSTLVKTKDVTVNADNISGAIDATFDTENGKVVTSYQNLDH